MDAAKSVAATFTTIQYALSVSKAGTGGGAVASSPAGITCGATCSAPFASGTVVTLTATSHATSTFTGWSGACTGTGSCSVTMDAAKAVTATFGSELLSLNLTASPANAASLRPSLSADGRFVAFQSDASDLVSGDTNGVRDVFVRDRQTGTTTRVSVSSTGTQGNGQSEYASLSGDGRYVAFYSQASTLVAGDTNGVADTFIHDRQTGTTTRVSVSSAGAQGNGESRRPMGISAGGRYVVFGSLASTLVAGDTNGRPDVFIRDQVANTTVRVSVGPGGLQANDGSYMPRLSADGRYVVFASRASNLVAGDTNGTGDIYRHDRDPDANGIFDEGNGVTVRVSVTGAGEVNLPSNKPTISANGQVMTYVSQSATLVAGDTNGAVDVFVTDLGAGTTRRVSVDSTGAQATTGATDMPPSLSGDGLLVAYPSEATTLVAGDTNGVRDVFLYQVATGATSRASVATDGSQSNGASDLPALSSDGRYVAFTSTATNLVTGDTNGVQDVFVRQW